MANVLIVDDDVQGSAALARLLAGEGHHAECVPSAGQAISHLRHHDPDLVLLDLSMPKVDGLDLLDALVAEPRFAHLKFAIYSGRNDDDAVKAAKRLGVCEYLVKGEDWGPLYDRIRACLPVETLQAS